MRFKIREDLFMKIINLFVIVMTFTLISGCSMESRVEYQEGFLGAVKAYVASVEDSNICANIDNIGLLNELAVQEGKTDLLRLLNIEGLFFKALAKNIDVVAAMENIQALETTKIVKFCDAAGVCREVVKRDNSQVVLAEYLKAIFGDCMDQTRFATLIDVFTGLYSKHAELIRGAVQNETLPQVFQEFDGYASCFEEIDNFAINTVAPFFRNLDIWLTVEEAGTELEPVLAKIPECLGLGGNNEGKIAAPVAK